MKIHIIGSFGGGGLIRGFACTWLALSTKSASFKPSYIFVTYIQIRKKRACPHLSSIARTLGQFETPLDNTGR
jgi:hypothetical protein